MSAWETDGQSDDWITPRYIFDGLGTEFDLDPANHPASHVPAKDSRYERALETPWFGFVWLNPPYGKRNGLTPWLARFIAHGDGIVLVPDRSSAPWFQHAAKRMHALLFLSPKVKFERPDGSIGAQPGCGSVLMTLGIRGCFALRRAHRLGLGFLAAPLAVTSDRAAETIPALSARGSRETPPPPSPGDV